MNNMQKALSVLIAKLIIGAGLSEPHTRELVENFLYIYMYIRIVRDSICSIKPRMNIEENKREGQS